jgi:hypothetical protein
VLIETNTLLLACENPNLILNVNLSGHHAYTSETMIDIRKVRAKTALEKISDKVIDEED